MNPYPKTTICAGRLKGLATLRMVSLRFVHTFRHFPLFGFVIKYLFVSTNEQGPNTPPTDPPPVSSPVSAPNPSPVVPPPVTSAPSPDEGDDEAGDDDEDEDDYYFPCEDSPLDMVLNIGRRNCDWVAENRDRCERAALASHCPVTCDVCDQCSDSRKRFVLEDGRRKKCSYFERNPDQCEEQSGVTETCRDACGFCGE
jgi:hypothetical protein